MLIGLYANKPETLIEAGIMEDNGYIDTKIYINFIWIICFKNHIRCREKQKILRKNPQIYDIMTYDDYNKLLSDEGCSCHFRLGVDEPDFPENRMTA